MKTSWAIVTPRERKLRLVWAASCALSAAGWITYLVMTTYGFNPAARLILVTTLFVLSLVTLVCSMTVVAEFSSARRSRQ